MVQTINLSGPGLETPASVTICTQGNVKELHAACFAFAAILEDDRVITWGWRDWGGSSNKAL